MKNPAFMSFCKRGWRTAALAAALATAALAGIAAAAERDVAAEATKKETKQPDSGKGKQATLTIEVFVVDPQKKIERQPAEDATVSIVGVEVRQKTNEKGRTVFVEIEPGKLELNIKVIGADLCKLQGISVAGGDQVVRVLVEKSDKGKCRRLE
jgi:hypothetical protein